MKKLLYLLLLFAGVVIAQNVPIPDQDFKAKLLNASPTNQIVKGENGNFITININGDNEIQESEALYARELYINNSFVINLSGIKSFIYLKKIDCSFNNLLTSIDVSNMDLLEILDCNNCQTLISLNVEGCNNMQSIYCQLCSVLKVIDVSTLKNLNFLNCPNCTLLEAILAKNGYSTDFTIGGSIGGTPLLRYICVDEDRVAYAQGLIATFSLINCHVNTFCTETPGGSYNTLKGIVSFDAQSPKGFIKLKCFIGSNVLQTTTNADGEYAFYTTENGVFTIALAAENTSAYTSISGLSQTGNFGTNNNGVIIIDFNLLSTSTVTNDVEMMIAPTFAAASGLKTYLVIVKNKGNQIASGTMKITSNQFATFVPPNLADLPIGVNLGIFQPGISNWTYGGIEPFQSVVFEVSYTIPTDTTPLNIGTEIVTTSLPDIDINDNNFACAENSTDSVTNPNTIQCLEGTSVAASQIGNYLHYMINIQNDGQGVADTIVIENTFDPLKYDIDSLQILGSTIDSDYELKPTVKLDVNGNKATYSFRKAGNGGPGGHGGVLLKLKTKANLQPGSSVTNSFRVNFEYDAPILVNGIATTFANLKVTDNQLDKSITMYPNPATSIINVVGSNTIQSVQVYDLQGRLLQTNMGNATSYVIDIADKANGVYFFKVTSSKGMKVERIVKE
jgi:Secretion system C-terminal sorting domain